ncbi:MAG: M20/M25/M40 family metallo-hydrolase [Planctomycetota bacterium]|nr:M20/M25/M40 family metallo-hydrolase [Planctomycetota bacterium]
MPQRHRLKFALLCYLPFVLLTPTPILAQYQSITPCPNDLAVGFRSITAEQARNWLTTLADPRFEGRGTGQAGYLKAAHWIAGKLAEFDLKAVADGDTYFQMMPITRRFPEIKECLIEGPDGFQLRGEGNLGFETYNNQATVTGEIVLLRFTGANPSLPETINLRDKIVLFSADAEALNQAPRLIAANRPAATLRVIEGQPTSRSETIFPGRQRRDNPVTGTIRKTAAIDLAKALNVTEPFTAAVTEIPVPVTIRMRIREEKAAAPNVVGLLEGSDPQLKDEYIVIGAHLDHLGTRGGTIYPGADDNGSGSTAVLSIARALSLNPLKPKRSVLFIWFTAEEVGLIGSRYYTDHPILPLDKMTCMFNIDMVGRNEDQGTGDTDADNEGHIHLVGSQRGDTELHNLILKANRHVGFQFELDMESVWNRSDQINFYEKGVPVAFLFGGFHPDYHQPSDTTDKINYPKIAAAGKLFYLAIFAAADHGNFPIQGDSGE